MNSAPSFEQWVKARRKARALTHRDLAACVGCSEQTIRKIESGLRRPSRQIAELLASCLGISQAEHDSFVNFARTGATAPAAASVPAAPSAPTPPAGPPTNLPAPLTPLIGRDPALTALAGQLGGSGRRLLTLVGPPGVGKTRLALAAGAAARPAFADGVFFVPLAPVSDPDRVPSAIARVLQLKDSSNQPLEERVVEHLRARQVLLVLDNCEQVVDAAPWLGELLAGCPALKVLATSREVWRVRGELPVAIAPLDLPPLDPLPPLDVLADNPAVRLFVERAEGIHPDFALTTENAAAVAAICARLEGLPLALELAAAQLPRLTPQDLLGRLTDRFALLVGGWRDLPERQQTLRATIEWSYDLLAPGEQILLARLGVFAGSCTLEAGEAVCDSEGDLPVPVLLGVRALIDKSLVQETPALPPRLLLLEMIGEYARERLSERGEEATLRRRHAEYYLTLAETAESQLVGADAKPWLDQLEADHDNLRAALAWTLDNGLAEIGARLAGALWRFWRNQGYLRDGRDWLERALAAPAPLPVPVRIKLLNGAGVLAQDLGDYAAAAEMLVMAIPLSREIGDVEREAILLNNLGTVTHFRGDVLWATTVYEASLALRRQLGDKRGIAGSLNNLGLVAHDRGDYERAAALFAESLALKREISSSEDIASTLYNLGLAAVGLGDPARAEQLFTESLALERATGHRYGIAIGLAKLGELALDRGDYAEATAYFEEGLDLSRQIGNRAAVVYIVISLAHAALYQGALGRATSLLHKSLTEAAALDDMPKIIRALEVLAGVAVAQDAPRRAAWLLGATEALREARSLAAHPVGQPYYDGLLAAVRAQLDAPTLAAAWAEGRACPLDQLLSTVQEEFGA